MKMKQLKKYVGVKKKVRIERNFPGNRYINGFVHDISDSLIIMQEFHDFFCEGYSVTRLSDIIDFRSNEYERFFEKIMEKEGLLHLIKYDHAIPLKNMKTVLSHFFNTQNIIIIECELKDNEEEDKFYIGKVSELENSIIWFRGFNALGEWDEEETGIKIETITRIQFDTPYINIFSKYVKPL